MVNQNGKSLDVSAKTIEEAIDQGLQQLRLARNQVEIEILNEGKRGIFGLGSEEAVVRLTPKSQVTENLPQGSDNPPPAEVEPSVEAEPSTPQAEEEPVAEVPTAEAEPAQEVEAQTQVDEAETQPSAEVDSENEVAAIAKRYLEELLQRMGIEADVTPRIAPDLVDPGEEPPLVLDVTGKDLGILIGRRSETLQALQYMVRLMVSKEMQSWQRVVIDVESYRARRRRSLHQLAKRMAERAIASGDRVVMESMSAYDRRIVHVALRDHPDVLTKSIGRDNNRKVTIIPK